MINDFLKKYQEELNTDRIQLKEDIDLLSTKIKEENKFISLLEESNKSYFKEFTPRNINSKNNEKVLEVKKKLESLNNEMQQKVDKLKFYDNRLLEINNLLLNISTDTTQVEDTNKVNNSFDIDLKTKLISIKDYLVLDPYRAKVDLENLISRL